MLKIKSLNTRDALRAAATKGCLGAVRFLLEEGVDKDAADKEGNTPSMLASQNNHLAVVQFLEEFKTEKKKGDMSLKKKSMDTRDALRAAADKGCMEAVRFLVEDEVCQTDKDKEGHTHLILAIQAGHTAVARYLVESMQTKKGKKGNRWGSDSWGGVALMFAAENGQFVVIQWLIEQGADNDKAGSNKTNGWGIAALINAAMKGDVAAMQWLLEQGVDKDMADKYDRTAFTTAAREDHLAVAQLLSEQGVDKEKANKWGDTPLMAAASRGHLAFVQWLLEQGADVNKTDNQGWTCLHYAVHRGYAEMVTCMMNWGASLTAKIMSGYRAGDLPIDITYDEAIKQLIRDEETRRNNHGYKRAVIPNPTDEERKRARLDRGEEEEEEKEGQGQGQGQATASAVAEEEDDGENDDSGSELEYD